MSINPHQDTGQAQRHRPTSDDGGQKLEFVDHRGEMPQIDQLMSAVDVAIAEAQRLQKVIRPKDVVAERST